jgi:hypothetical protein
MNTPNPNIAVAAASSTEHIMKVNGTPGPATAATTGTPGPSSPPGPSPVAAAAGPIPAGTKHAGLRFARSVKPHDQLDPTSTIGVYVYKQTENPQHDIKNFPNHLFAVIEHVHEKEYTTKVYTYQEFIKFMNSLDVPSIAAATANPIIKYAFAVGMHNKDYGNSWRMVTEAEWMDFEFQAKLVKAHQESGGWALLEESLICNNGLYVAEGLALIDNEMVVEVGHNGSQQLQSVYPAMNEDTKVAWTMTPPALGNNWTIDKNTKILSYPCLFVRTSAPTAPTKVAMPASAP